MRRLALVLALAAGCPKRGPSPEDVDAVVVAPVDEAWAARDARGLAPVHRALGDVPAGLRGRPEVAWRAARLAIAEGELADDPAEARRAFARARGEAMTCLQGDRTVAGLVLQGRTADAVAAVPQGRTACAAWAGYAWARWLATMPGAAVAVDLPVLDALLAVGAVDPDPERLVWIAWARALEGMVAPREGRSVDPLAALRPDVEGAWVRYEDLLRHAPELAGTPPTLVPATPEDRGAHARVTADGVP